MIDNATVGRSGLHSAAAIDVLCSCDEQATDVPRVTLICAHPDDEVIGAGARLLHLPDLVIVQVTDGAPRDMADAIANGFASREAYARARAAERARALAIARIPSDRIYDCGLVDQEASFSLLDLTHRVVALLDAWRPDVVLTHAYEGGHPDHDATAFAVHFAVELVRRRDGTAPMIAEFTGYHWRDGAMRTACFIPGAAEHTRTVSLGSDDRRLKNAMFACYATQQRVLASFPTDVECFRVAPRYDFTAPPHEGQLFYEWFDWRVTGADWRQLARRALLEIGDVVTPC